MNAQKILEQTTLSPKQQAFWLKKMEQKLLSQDELYQLLNDLEDSFAQAELKKRDLQEEFKNNEEKRERNMQYAIEQYKKALKKQKYDGMKKMRILKSELKKIEMAAENKAHEISSKLEKQAIARIKKKI